MSQETEVQEFSRRRLARCAVEWSNIRVDVQDVIDAAVDALVAGLDSESLRELAGMSPRDDIQDVSEVIASALKRLAMPMPERGSQGALRLLLGYRCQAFLSGRMNARADPLGALALRSLAV
ncbi:hypothetical protein ACI2IX_16680 [Leifsonia aquatica]|uniref:hypothetical protein n=1 Tax=Leifsonia aquatica TaxID=144185 RepID=UPI0038517347